MDYSLPKFKSKAERVGSKILKKHHKAAVEKVLSKHEKGESKKEERDEHK